MMDKASVEGLYGKDQYIRRGANVHKDGSYSAGVRI
jgi:hypothetical protein